MQHSPTNPPLHLHAPTRLVSCDSYSLQQDNQDRSCKHISRCSDLNATQPSNVPSLACLVLCLLPWSAPSTCFLHLPMPSASPCACSLCLLPQASEVEFIPKCATAPSCGDGASFTLCLPNVLIWVAWQPPIVTHLGLGSQGLVEGQAHMASSHGKLTYQMLGVRRACGVRRAACSVA